MKYFTPELIERGDSLDDDVADAASEQWERSLTRYARRWRTIRDAFPASVQRFNDERVCLHDAGLLSLGQEGDYFVMVLQPESPARTLVHLTFTLDAEPVIDRAALPGREDCSQAHWLYEEFDLDRQKRCFFEVVFSNGWSVKLRFRDFTYQIAQRLFPVPTNFAPAQPAVAQPA